MDGTTESGSGSGSGPRWLRGGPPVTIRYPWRWGTDEARVDDRGADRKRKRDRDAWHGREAPRVCHCGRALARWEPDTGGRYAIGFDGPAPRPSGVGVYSSRTRTYGVFQFLPAGGWSGWAPVTGDCRWCARERRGREARDAVRDAGRGVAAAARDARDAVGVAVGRIRAAAADERDDVADQAERHGWRVAARAEWRHAAGRILDRAGASPMVRRARVRAGVDACDRVGAVRPARHGDGSPVVVGGRIAEPGQWTGPDPRPGNDDAAGRYARQRYARPHPDHGRFGLVGYGGPLDPLAPAGTLDRDGVVRRSWPRWMADMVHDDVERDDGPPDLAADISAVREWWRRCDDDVTPRLVDRDDEAARRAAQRRAQRPERGRLVVVVRRAVERVAARRGR